MRTDAATAMPSGKMCPLRYGKRQGSFKAWSPNRSVWWGPFIDHSCLLIPPGYISCCQNITSLYVVSQKMPKIPLQDLSPCLSYHTSEPAIWHGPIRHPSLTCQMRRRLCSNAGTPSTKKRANGCLFYRITWMNEISVRPQQRHKDGLYDL